MGDNLDNGTLQCQISFHPNTDIMLGSKCKDAHNLFDFHVEEKFVQILFDFCPEENLPFLQDLVKFTEKELDI